jgi:hypothetical protein
MVGLAPVELLEVVQGEDALRSAHSQLQSIENKNNIVNISLPHTMKKAF